MGSYGQQPADPTTLLNKCREINEGISDIRAKREGQLAAAQNGMLDSSNVKEDQVSRQTLDYIEDEINNGFRYLRDLMKKIKQTPGSGDSRVQTQIDVASRNLRREIEQYQKTQSDFQKRLREQVRRRYEIANPEASPEELDAGVENVLMGQEQMFQVCGWLTGYEEMKLLTRLGLRKPNRPGQRRPQGRHGAIGRHPQDRAGHDGAGSVVPGSRRAGAPAGAGHRADQPRRRGSRRQRRTGQHPDQPCHRQRPSRPEVEVVRAAGRQ